MLRVYIADILEEKDLCYDKIWLHLDQLKTYDDLEAISKGITPHS